MNKLNVLNVSDANKFAFIKGNRPTDEKAIKVKKDSISEHGILCPITAVNGEEVIKSNGHLTDLDGNDIADEHAKDYYAVLDGQHRLKAYLELGLPLEDLVVIEPLNKKIAIALLIAEMNICTKTWKGSDYMAAPAMAIKEKMRPLILLWNCNDAISRFRQSRFGRVATTNSKPKIWWQVLKPVKCPNVCKRLTGGVPRAANGLKRQVKNSRLNSSLKSI